MLKSTPKFIRFHGAVYKKTAQESGVPVLVLRANVIETIVLVLRDLSQMISTPVKSLTAQLAKPAPVARMMRQHITELAYNSGLMYELLRDLESIQQTAHGSVLDIQKWASSATPKIIKDELAKLEGRMPEVDIREDAPEVP